MSIIFLAGLTAFLHSCRPSPQLKISTLEEALSEALEPWEEEYIKSVPWTDYSTTQIVRDPVWQKVFLAAHDYGEQSQARLAEAADGCEAKIAAVDTTIKQTIKDALEGGTECGGILGCVPKIIRGIGERAIATVKDIIDISCYAPEFANNDAACDALTRAALTSHQALPLACGPPSDGEGEGGEGEEECTEGRCIPNGWHCPESYFGADDGCDCGCGASDADCGSPGSASGPPFADICEYCYNASADSVPCKECTSDCSLQNRPPECATDGIREYTESQCIEGVCSTPRATVRACQTGTRCEVVDGEPACVDRVAEFIAALAGPWRATPRVSGSTAPSPEFPDGRYRCGADIQLSAGPDGRSGVIRYVVAPTECASCGDPCQGGRSFTNSFGVQLRPDGNYYYNDPFGCRDVLLTLPVDSIHCEADLGTGEVDRWSYLRE